MVSALCSLREDIIVEINCDAGLWPIQVDPNQFELVILNLAVNARDAMPDGGLLLINAKNMQTSSGDFVSISLTDSGTGMSQEVQAKAFEPFFTTKAAGRGTGLGLSQVYGFAVQAGGTAQILSQEGKGTTLTLMLPRAHGRAPSGKPVDDLVPLPKGSGRILVVEDDSNVAVVVIEMLKELGYEPIRAANAEEAMRILETDKEFDLVFSDIVMPGEMNGIELAEQIQQRFPAIRILLTTGYARTPLPYPIATLRKPYGPQELARAIDQARKLS